MRLIDADELKKAIHNLYRDWLLMDLDNVIDNAPTVPQVTVFAENASKEEIENFKQELEKVLERPQGDVNMRNNNEIKYCRSCKHYLKMITEEPCFICNSWLDKWETADNG